MKKLSYSMLILCLALALCCPAMAAEKIVRLDVPGCRPCGAAGRISSIMKNISGVNKYELKDPSLLIVTFDDEQTSLQLITDALKKGDFSVKGKPVYLKQDKKPGGGK